jgi:hypothetical protein
VELGYEIKKGRDRGKVRVRKSEKREKKGFLVRSYTTVFVLQLLGL